jgi:penicillin-binding protein 1B
MFRRLIFSLQLWWQRRRYGFTTPHKGRRRALIIVASGMVLLGLYTLYLDLIIRTQFEGKRWALPARVYARPMELFTGKSLTTEEFASELLFLGYRKVSDAKRPGTFARQGNSFDVVTRPFTFWDSAEPSRHFQVTLSGNRVTNLANLAGDDPLGLVRLDPGLIASIYPKHNEDRILVKVDEAPPLLIKALLAVEDQDFYTHHGVKPLSIMRAMFANLRAGRTVQGGSTLTQQLVKNFFLSNERTLWRKFNEALMALLLEWHYSKDEILEAYLNEIFLGQDGKRAIHGFALASEFYFQRPLSELQPNQIALLVALVKGASYYDPRRHPLRAQQRRNLVLELMVKQGDISKKEATEAMRTPLDVTPKPASGVSKFPAFLDLVRDQLRRDYRDEDLSSEGLQIFTTLDPLVQKEAERALSSQVARLEKSRHMVKDALQGAMVVTSVAGGEVLAVVGDRNPRFAGFNRAVNATRQIGSLVKPAVYLTALSQPDKYTLITPLEDLPVELKGDDGKEWEPHNFDNESHGEVPLYAALAHSYNLSTVHLGLDLGVPAVADTLRNLGVEGEINPYPSLLLGAISLTPVEVTKMYHTLANNGFRSPLRTIRAVLTVDGAPLQRFPLAIEKVFDSGPVFLTTSALREVVRSGTGRALNNILPKSLNIAGKTGTSDDLRDSWFAGFTSEILAVVWLGMDNNESTGLTGSSGALRVWGSFMRNINTRPGSIKPPQNVEYVWIDPANNLRADDSCDGAIKIPFIRGSAPVDESPCMRGIFDRFF